MTVTGKQTNFLIYFFTLYRKNLIRELYRGTEPIFWRTNISWLSFLYFDYRFKNLFKKIRSTDFLCFSDLLLISIIVGFLCNFISKYKITYKLCILIS